MCALEIKLYPAPVLRAKSAEVSEVTEDLRRLFDEMAQAMYDAAGIGLAAPQVGIEKRVVVINVGGDEKTGTQPRLYKIANPKILSASGEIEIEEGCLSIPDIRAGVVRYSDVEISYLDEHSKPSNLRASGLLAVCIQHEIDHLDGVLFVDRLRGAKRDMVLTKLKNLQKQAKKQGLPVSV